MKITMLGTSAAVPDPERADSAIHISIGDKSYLFDCGHGATRQMIKAGIDPTEVNHIFLSHLHYDHISEFPYFLLTTWICDRELPPVVVGPPGTQSFVDHLFEDGAFAKDIEARAQYPRRQNVEILRPEVRECQPGLIFEDELVSVKACFVEHIPREISECFGLRLDTKDGKSISFSGDTAPCDAFVELSKGVDVMIHECTFPEEAIEFRKKVKVGTWAHTSPIELGKLASEARAKCLIATHFGSFDSLNPVVQKTMGVHMPQEIMGPHQLDLVEKDIKESYSGELHLAYDLMEIEL